MSNLKSLALSLGLASSLFFGRVSAQNISALERAGEDLVVPSKFYKVINESFSFSNYLPRVKNADGRAWLENNCCLTNVITPSNGKSEYVVLFDGRIFPNLEPVGKNRSGFFIKKDGYVLSEDDLYVLFDDDFVRNMDLKRVGISFRKHAYNGSTGISSCYEIKRTNLPGVYGFVCKTERDFVPESAHPDRAHKIELDSGIGPNSSSVYVFFTTYEEANRGGLGGKFFKRR